MNVKQDVLTKSDEELEEIDNNQQTEPIAAEELSVNEVEQVYSSIVKENTTKIQNVDNPTTFDQVNTEQIIKFCRHCGGKLDYQFNKYCKHCGKQLY